MAEARGGRPTRVKGTGKKSDTGVLRIDFAEPNADLEEIGWDEFFDKFDRSKLALVYQEETAAGDESRFAKLVRREE